MARSNGMTNEPITLRPRRITIILGAAAVLLVFASTAGQVSKFFFGHSSVKGLVPLFYLDNEGNVPTFFSVLLILLATLLLSVTAVLKVRLAAPYRWRWTILASGFLLMACDEAFHVHEELLVPMRNLLGGGKLGIFNFAWVVPGIALVLILGLFFLKFWLQLPRRTRTGFLVAAALYLSGAIGFELAGGAYAEAYSVRTFTFALLCTLEESLEMAGMIVFIQVLLEHLNAYQGEVRFTID